MQTSFARRFDGVSGSAIRDIFKLLGQPGMISFAGGNPAASALEDTLLADIARDVLLRDGKRILQYGATEGWVPLREQTARFLREDVGLEVSEADVLPTTGSTQAVDLLLKALVDEGDVVLVEGPSFLGSLQAMKLYGARLVEVPMDAEGLIPEKLEEAVRQYRPKLLYTVPNFQNPTGVTLSQARRKAVAALAARYNFFIAEDDPYRGLRYEGTHLPSIFSFDTEARVVYLTSFSKLISPGLRVGAAVTRDPALMRKLTVGKQSTDCHTRQPDPGDGGRIPGPGPAAGACAENLRALSRAADPYGGRLCGLPGRRRNVRPQGGLFVWAALPDGMDALALLQQAVQRGVAYVPGTHFYANGGHLNTLRLNFSNSEIDQIDRGMRILGELVKGGQ